MLQVREATAAEAAQIFPGDASYETWTGVLIEDGELAGHICLSRALGQVFGHNTSCYSSDQSGAAMLWLCARAKAKEWGAECVIVHEEPDTPERIREFWRRLGFVHIASVLKGPI